MILINSHFVISFSGLSSLTLLYMYVYVIKYLHVGYDNLIV